MHHWQRCKPRTTTPMTDAMIDEDVDRIATVLLSGRAIPTVIEALTADQPTGTLLDRHHAPPALATATNLVFARALYATRRTT